MINIAICDDDQNDLNAIAKMLRDILRESNVECKLHMYVSAKKMLHELKNIDISILDISMKELNGIDLGRKIKMKFPNVTLMYITSFTDYCMQAINDVHAFTFLCKPLNRDKFQKQIIEIIKNYSGIDEVERIFLNVKDELGRELCEKKIKLNDIMYFEYIKTKRRIKIVLNSKSYQFSYVMEKLAEELCDYNFYINCRGCLVNLEHVLKIKGYNIYLDNGEVLPLSQKRVSKFKETLNEFLHNKL